MDTSYVFDGWQDLFSSKNSRVELIRQVLHHLPLKYFQKSLRIFSATSFPEVQKCYQYYMDDIQKGANNFADEVLKGSSNEENVGDCINKLLKSANDMVANVRAPVRGGSLPNRKAQYAKISRELIVKENIKVSSNVNATDLGERKYVGRPTKQVIESSPKSDNPKGSGPAFVTARQQLIIDSKKQQGGHSASPYAKSEVVKKSLGSRGPRMAFVPPFARSKDENQQSQPTGSGLVVTAPQSMCSPTNENTVADERLKQFDQKTIDLIMSEIMDSDTKVTWDDIAGLHSVKTTLKEVVVFPMLRPDIFTGLRGPPKGLLLFGPPGTGKTLIGRCIASISKSTFFSISASSLTSKWVGDGEKMVRALFTIARMYAPAVIFIDEVDSLLSQRSETEHESSRRIKTEFLVQLDGVSTGSEERLLLIGATNRPQELDEAARRRFVKRLYVPLPCEYARREIVERLIKQQKHNLTPDDLDMIAAKSEGFSGADVANLCREAAMGPIRGLPLEVIESISAQDVPSVGMSDFLAAFRHVKASVSPNDLKQYISWNQQYGSFQV